MRATLLVLLLSFCCQYTYSQNEYIYYENVIFQKCDKDSAFYRIVVEPVKGDLAGILICRYYLSNGHKRDSQTYLCIVDCEDLNSFPDLVESKAFKAHGTHRTWAEQGWLQDVKTYDALGKGSDSIEPGLVYSKIYIKADNMPVFPGGTNGLIQFISSNVVYPKEALDKGIEESILVKFIVNESGVVTDPIILKGNNELLKNEALRVVKLIPNWKPGSHKGKPVSVYYTLPITFQLDGPIDED